MESLRPSKMLDFVPTEPSGHEFKSNSEPTFYSYSNFLSLFRVHVSFRSLPSSVATFAFKQNLAQVITIVAEDIEGNREREKKKRRCFLIPHHIC